jgi:hypothetical protein
MTLTTTSFDRTMKDMYPAPGERIKQWVIDEQRTHAWERETCPKLLVPFHYEDQDDSDAESGTIVACPSVGTTSLLDIHARGGDGCRFCDGFAQAAQQLPTVREWFVARARYKVEHPICSDREKLSDEIAPDISLAENPIFALLKRSR